MTKTFYLKNIIGIQNPRKAIHLKCSRDELTLERGMPSELKDKGQRLHLNDCLFYMGETLNMSLVFCVTFYSTCEVFVNALISLLSKNEN